MCASCLLLPIWDAFLEPTCRIIGDRYQKVHLFKTSRDFEAGKGSTYLSGNSRRSMAMFRLSSIISGLDKLASYITSSSSSSCDPCGTDELVELKDSVVRTRNYVMDSRGVVGDASVKLWLMELNNLVHLIDHILVESASEHQRSSKEQQPQLVNCRKRAKLEKKEPAPDVINCKVQEIRKRFHEMSADWAAIHLTESDVGMQFQQQRSSPSGFQIDESCIFGRDHDKNKVIELLFSDDSKRGNVSIISIVGVAGIGKTTLAQLAYSDPKICAHFTARGWVCVSGDIDAVRLLQAIIQSVTGKACQDKDLVTLERRLERALKGTKFLLVLDDVKEDDSLWDCLWSPLLGAETSKIVVTSRNELVSNSIQELVLPHHLSSLSEANCWSLFRRFAFDGEDPNEHPNLVEIGRRIAAMCRGWPLAAKTLGVLLRFETDEDRWLDILQGEVLGLVGGLNLTLQPSDGAW